MKRYVLVLLSVMMLISSCEKSEQSGGSGKKEPEITSSVITGNASNITFRSLELSGQAKVKTSSKDLNCGILCSTSSAVIIGDAAKYPAKTFDSSNNFTVTVENLEPEITYYYRAYLVQGNEFLYGETKSFKTQSIRSILETGTATNLTTNGATLPASLNLSNCTYNTLSYGFEIIPDGGSSYFVQSTDHSSNKYTYEIKNLFRDTRYEYRAYVTLDYRMYKSDTKSFKTLDKTCPSGAVDLGLSVFWAPTNLGASSPEGYGLYYQWGDTQGYTSNKQEDKRFDETSYKWYDTSKKIFTKYCTKSPLGTPDNITVLEPADDAATKSKGNGWRIPTIDEWKELLDNCTWTWTTIGSVYGYKVQAKREKFAGNYIFLPASGIRCITFMEWLNEHGRYWSSTLYEYQYAYVINFDWDNTYWGFNYRYYGLTIRPVHD